MSNQSASKPIKSPPKFFPCDGVVHSLLGICVLQHESPTLGRDQITLASVGGSLVVRAGDDSQITIQGQVPRSEVMWRATRFSLDDPLLFDGDRSHGLWQQTLRDRIRALIGASDLPPVEARGGISSTYGQLWAEAGVRSGGFQNYRGNSRGAHWSDIVRGNPNWRTAFRFEGFPNTNPNRPRRRLLEVPRPLLEDLQRLLGAGYPLLVPIWWWGMLGFGARSTGPQLVECEGGNQGFNGNHHTSCYGGIRISSSSSNHAVAAWQAFRRGEATCELVDGNTALRPPPDFFRLFQGLINSLLGRRRPFRGTQRARVAHLACRGLPTCAETTHGTVWCHPYRRERIRLSSLVLGGIPQNDVLSGFIEVGAELGLDEVLGGHWVDLMLTQRECKPNGLGSLTFVRLRDDPIIQQTVLSSAQAAEWERIASQPSLERKDQKRLMAILRLSLGDSAASDLRKRVFPLGLSSSMFKAVDPGRIPYPLNMSCNCPECREAWLLNNPSLRYEPSP